MGIYRTGLQKISGSLIQERFCDVCGRPFKKANLPMLENALVADCDCFILNSNSKKIFDKQMEMRIEGAKIPSRLLDLKLETYPDKDSGVVSTVNRYVARDRPGLMLLVGSRGRGKSGLACQALRMLSARGSIRYFYSFDLLTERVSRDTMEVMNEALRPATIAIDEIGLQLKTAAANEFMERLLIGRHDDYKNTILISNLGPKDFKSLIGDRAWDRATNDGMVVVFSGETFRGKS